MEVLESVEDLTPPEDGVPKVTEQGLPMEELPTVEGLLRVVAEGVPKLDEEGVPGVLSLNRKLSDSDSKLNGNVCFNQAEKKTPRKTFYFHLCGLSSKLDNSINA